MRKIVQSVYNACKFHDNCLKIFEEKSARIIHHECESDYKIMQALHVLHSIISFCIFTTSVYLGIVFQPIQSKYISPLLGIKGYINCY